jgi:N-acyl-L-homoserine lactone synthetase
MKAFLIDNTNRHKHTKLVKAMHKHRHDLFVDCMGWTELRSSDGLDFDQFDTKDTKYLVLVDEKGELLGSDRLNISTGPHLLADVFPHFATDAIPRGPTIWEWSRHAPGRPEWIKRDNQKIRLHSTIAILEFAQQYGVTAFTGILESKVLPAAIGLGWEPKPLGSPVDYGQGEGVACVCPVNLELLARLRRVAGLTEPLLDHLSGSDAARTINNLPYVDVCADKEVQLALLREHGVLVIENAITPEVLAQLRKETDPWFNQAPGGTGAFFGRKTRRFGGLLQKAPISQELILHDTLLALSESVLSTDAAGNPRCNAIQLNVTQAIGIEPGEPEQVIHRDQMLYPFTPDFELLVNIMWCIDDFTCKNGATHFVPGSCNWDLQRWPTPAEVVQAEAKAGSAIMWLGSMMHGGGANMTNTMRKGIIISYSLGWLQPTERLLLSVSSELARSLPERLQRLLGYQVHKPSLGWVEGRDPIEWLRGELRDLGAAQDHLPDEQEAIVEGYYIERTRQINAASELV